MLQITSERSGPRGLCECTHFHTTGPWGNVPRPGFLDAQTKAEHSGSGNRWEQGGYGQEPRLAHAQQAAASNRLLPREHKSPTISSWRRCHSLGSERPAAPVPLLRLAGQPASPRHLQAQTHRPVSLGFRLCSSASSKPTQPLQGPDLPPRGWLHVTWLPLLDAGTPGGDYTSPHTLATGP